MKVITNGKLGRRTCAHPDDATVDLFVNNGADYEFVATVTREEAHRWFHGNERSEDTVPPRGLTVDEMLEVIEGLEGEGSFNIYAGRPTATVVNSDFEILDRFYALIGCGAIYPAKANKLSKKPSAVGRPTVWPRLITSWI